MNGVMLTLPATKIRNGGAGDWTFAQGGTLVVASIDTGHEDSDALIKLHEFVEALLCKKAGITDEEVTAWDAQCKDEEPGSNPTANYHIQHMVALEVEMIVCRALGINWEAHEERITRALKG